MTARLFVVLIGTYRAVSAGRAPKCRFVPSCSEYAAQAVSDLGPLRALPLIVKRLARCRPGGGFGYDPVPRPGEGPRASSPIGGLASGPGGERA